MENTQKLIFCQGESISANEPSANDKTNECVTVTLEERADQIVIEIHKQNEELQEAFPDATVTIGNPTAYDKSPLAELVWQKLQRSV